MPVTGQGGFPHHSNHRKRILFVCTYNSVRSQMAEGILRHLYGNSYEVASAGIAPAGVSRYAIWVLRERGVDISAHRSKALTSLPPGAYDLIVTICDEAGCAVGSLPPAGRVLHHPFQSPMEMGSEEEVLEAFRALRDRVWEWIKADFRP
ncbi:MAG: arsenate reductase ArsC [Methanolinea sp.]|jgi:arsenate reductase|nr:arsenate reductase ArsC [Methanolinea sp.]